MQMLIKDRCWRLYLSTDRNHFWADTSGIFQTSLKKSDQWSWMTLREQLAILKMAAIRQYLFTDQNSFRVDTSRH